MNEPKAKRPGPFDTRFGRLAAGVLQILGVLTAACVLISGPHAYGGGWQTVLWGCLAGGMFFWAGRQLGKSPRGDSEPESKPRVSLVDWFSWLTAIAAVCGLWKLLFPPSGSQWPMDLLLAVVVPSATIAVGRRAGPLRGWCFSVFASTALMTISCLPFNGHTLAKTRPWLALADAVWLGPVMGSSTWAVVVGVTWLLRRTGRRSG